MPFAAMSHRQPPTPFTVVLIIMTMLVVTLPVVAFGGSALGGWLARAGFGFAPTVF